MKAITLSEARGDLNKIMDEVCRNHEPVIVTHSRGESVVILSLADYESIMESEYLLSSPVNAARLVQSIAQAQSGQRLPLDALGR